MATKIVVCDDEQDILDITQLILEDEGFEVIPVLNSLVVESIIAAEKPEVLLIDLWMPGLSGDQVIASLKSQEQFQYLPIVVISASKDGRQIASTCGANDFLEKPYDIDKLIHAVKKQIN